MSPESELKNTAQIKLLTGRAKEGELGFDNQFKPDKNTEAPIQEGPGGCKPGKYFSFYFQHFLKLPLRPLCET